MSLVLYFMGGVFILAGISIVMNGESDASIIFGGASLLAGGYMIFLGGKDSGTEWKKLNTKRTLGVTSRTMDNARLWYGIIYYK